MRRAMTDTQWMDEGGRFIGVILGFDFCAEHEFGTGGLRNALQVPPEGGIGLAARKIGACPEQLRLVEYNYKPRDRRRKGVPAAILYYVSRQWVSDDEVLKFVKSEAHFYSEQGDRWHRGEQDDLVCAWDANSFAIHVRGPQNIERLRTLYAAFKRTDIVANSPSVMGFFRNGGLAFGVLSAFGQEALDTIQAQDEAAARLKQALADTAVEQTALENGRPASIGNAWWDGGDPASLKVFLMPHDSRRYQRAWLTVAEAQAWAAGAHFLDCSPELEAAETRAEQTWGRDWQYDLERRIEASGVKFASLSFRLLAADGRLALRLWPTRETAHHLPFGQHTVDDLMAQFPVSA